MKLNKNIKILVVHIISLILKLKIVIYLIRKSQIAFVFSKNIIILAKYLDFTNIFLEKLVVVLLK